MALDKTSSVKLKQDQMSIDLAPTTIGKINMIDMIGMIDIINMIKYIKISILASIGYWLVSWLVYVQTSASKSVVIC